MTENLIIKKLFKRKRHGTAEVSGDSSFLGPFCPPVGRGKEFIGTRLEACDLKGVGGRGREEGETGEMTLKLHFCHPHPHILPSLLQRPPHPTQQGPVNSCGGHWPRTQLWCPFPALLSFKFGPLPFTSSLPGALPLSLGHSSASTAWVRPLCLTPPLPPALTQNGTCAGPRAEPHLWASSDQWTNRGVQ